MSDVVLLEKRGLVAWITINRPEAMNSINEAVREQLPACVRTADVDPDVRVIVVRGAGQRAFCAGADIKEFGAVGQPADYRQSRVHASWIRPFDEAVKPIIASIHGYCLGGGLEIALACDLRVASRDAVFGFPETGLGLVTGVGGSQRLVRLVGCGHAMDLFLTGERIGIERAYSLGIVTRHGHYGLHLAFAAPSGIAGGRHWFCGAIAQSSGKGIVITATLITRGLAHAIPVKKLQAMGVAAVIYPRLLASRAIPGMTKGRDALRQVLGSQEVVDRSDLAMSFEELNNLVGLQDLLDIEQQFLTKDQLHSKHSRAPDDVAHPHPVP